MEKTPPAWLKPTVDYAPLAVFLIAFETQGLMVATAALMATTLAALVLSWVLTRRVPMIPLVTAVIVGVFGGLTLWLKDETFIKLKPTILYCLFSAVLGIGWLRGKWVLKAVIGDALPIDDAGWRRLSLRFALFFLAMAGVNEIVRRVLTTDMWVLWKVPGSIVITFIFILAQTGLIRRHRLPDQEG